MAVFCSLPVTEDKGAFGKSMGTLPFPLAFLVSSFDSKNDGDATGLATGGVATVTGWRDDDKI